jgi:hypothetical protein
MDMFALSAICGQKHKEDNVGTVRALVICLVAGTLVILGSIVPGDTVHAAPATQKAQLQQLSTDLARRLEARRTPLYYELLRSSNPAQQRLNANPDIQLMYIRESGVPAYYTVENLNAAKTVSTYNVWPGGSGGFSLSGSGTTLGKLAEWDGGGVLTTHRELTGRVTQMDSPGATHYHSTHVAGTMIGQGVSGTAKGMSFQGTLAAYDWTNDTSEMASAAAAGMNVSNHSYGFITGWYYDARSRTTVLASTVWKPRPWTRLPTTLPTIRYANLPGMNEMMLGRGLAEVITTGMAATGYGVQPRASPTVAATDTIA